MSAENDRFGLDDVRALAQVMKDFDLGGLELRRASGERLYLTRERTASPVAPLSHHAGASAGGAAQLVTGNVAGGGAGSGSAHSASGQAAANQAPAQAQNLTVINAPLVGTFYRSAGPDTPPFVEVGQRVRKGQTLCIIEAMKLMNELESEFDGVVAACLADNGRPVEYGQPLFHIERASDRQKP